MSHRKQLAQDLVRELLAEARRDEERGRARAERLRALVRAGRAAGVSAGSLAEAAGLSRPGVSDVASRDALGPVDGLDAVVLLAVAGAGATTRESLRSVLRVPREQIDHVVEELLRRGAISAGAAGYDSASQTEILLLAPAGEEQLDLELRRALGTRPEHWTAYVAVEDETEGPRLLAVAQDLFGRHRTALLPRSTRHDMTTDELALAFDVSDEIGLFNAAAAAWHQLRVTASLSPAPLRIVAFSPPRERSYVLEAFGRGMIDARPGLEKPVTRAIADAAPAADERSLAVTVLTEAASALRAAVGQERPAPELATGDAAFQEWQAVAGLRLDAKTEKSQKALERALERATDRLGPIPGGRIGRFAGAEPNIVESVDPSPADLLFIATAAGEAVAFAEAAHRDRVRAVDILRKVVRASG